MSWEAISSIAAEAAGLAEAGRKPFLDAHCPAELRAEVDSLLAYDGSPGPLDRPIAWSLAVPPLPERFGPYRRLRQLGEGGMGIVFLAERDDGQFTRQVAVKLMGGIARGALARRFASERGILASLDHPNIARLEDAGVTAEGQPFLVMEFVDGEPIDRFSRERSLGIRERCRLLIDVCAAVDYAHQRLVLHRDIKASNILVTAAGVPKLLDFGIAKLLDPGEGAAAATAMALTPAYASPEQCAGKPLTTASDVYSLGVVLFELLAGRKPFVLDGKPLIEALRVVADERAPLASSIRRDIPRDLDAIVAKALAAGPGERYPNARELAADLERFLKGEPVAARAPGLWYVASRLVSRHRIPVALTLAALALTGFSLATALRERRAAVERFNHLRQFAGTLVGEVEEKAEAIPGTLELRKRVVQLATGYYETLAREDLSGNPELAAEVAAAFARLGAIQGAPNQPNLGETAAARASFERALMLARQVAGTNNSLQAGVRVAEILDQLASVEMHAKRVDAARAASAEARKEWQKLVQRFPAEDRVRRGLASNLIVSGGVTEDVVEKRGFHEAALAEYQRMRDGGDAHQRNIALAHKYIAATWLNSDLAKARLHAEAAERIDAGRVAAQPGVREPLLDHSFDLSTLATLAERMKRFEDGAELAARAVAARREIWRREPKDNWIRGRLAFGLGSQATFALLLGRVAEGEKYWREGAGHFRAARQVSGTAPSADTLSSAAQMLALRARSHDEACQWLTRGNEFGNYRISEAARLFEQCGMARP